MSKAKHTPGPWIQDEGNPLCIGTPKPWYPRQVYRIVATLEGGKEYTANHNATAEANARLIAAAPDMLAVLRMVDALGLMEFPDGPDDPFTLADIEPHSLDLWRAARAAIAKATGEND